MRDVAAQKLSGRADVGDEIRRVERAELRHAVGDLRDRQNREIQRAGLEQL